MEYDLIKLIETTTDKKYLIELLDKWIPIDLDNIEKNSFELQAKMWNTTPEKYKKKQLKGILKFKSIVEKRLKQLK